MRPEVRRQLAQDLPGWYERGWIDRATFEALSQRYDRAGFGLGRLVQSLGIAGGVFVVLGMIGGAIVALELPWAGAGILVLAGGFGLAIGLLMAADAQRQFAFSSRIVIAAAFAFLVGAGFAAAVALEADMGEAAGPILLAAGAVGVAVAYPTGNVFLCILGVLSLFQGIGVSSSYTGGGTYVVGVGDPVATLLAGLVCAGLGWFHGDLVEARYARSRGFANVYLVFGLLHANLALLVLSIEGEGGKAVAWAVALAAFCLGQVVLGAWHDRGTLTGFGVTFFVIDLYTRYHELFWERLSLATFLVVPGLVLLAAGVAVEWGMRRAHRPA